MRTISAIFFAASLVLVSSSAFAGSMSLSNGKAIWQTSNCTEPTAPPSLLAADKETHAGDMNHMMENYNAYAANMQTYMNCISKEAETDSGSINEAITKSAQASIEAAHKKVSDFHDALQAKK